MADKTIAIKVELAGATEQGKKLAKLEEGVLSLSKRNRALNKALKEGDSALKKLNLTRSQAIKELALNNTKLKGYRAELLKTRQAILGIDSFTKKLGKSFSRLGTSISGAFVGLFAVQKLFQIIGDAVNTIAEFEQQMANVKAITGATEEEFKALEKSAKELGRTTRRTALEVAQLQEEYAKLGFTTEEILAATEATVQLSEATGSDLAQSANVAASTLNGFRLEADETQRIVDVMAASFTSSALDLGKFEVAMRQVAPVAAEAGLTIEETTAFLGVLADNGIRAETAGTGLRNIFLTLAQTGLTLEEAMDGINSSTDKAAAATELFGKENAVVATTIANNTIKIEEQTEALNGAAGAAEEMAEITGDTLSGDIDRLSSAWDGFILSLDEGEGTLNKVLRGAVEFATSLLELFQEIDKVEEARKVNADVLRKSKTFELQKIKEIEQATKSIAKDEEEFERFRANQLKDREVTLARVIANEEEALTLLEQKLGAESELTEEQKINLDNERTNLEVLKQRLKFLEKFNQKEEEKRNGIKEETSLQKLLANIEQANEKKLNELASIGVESAKKELDRRKELEKQRKAAAKAEEKRIKDEARAKKKAQQQAEKDLEDSLKNTTKLEQEATVLGIENKKDAELQKLEFARQRALAEVKITENTEKEKAAINAKFDAERKALEDQRKLEDDEKEGDERDRLREEAIAFAEQTASALIDVTSKKVERQKEIELSALNAELENGLITQEQFEKKREDIERKAFQKQKRLDIAQALANGAVAITKTIAQLGGLGAITPAGAAALGFVGAQTAVQTGIIASQQFAEGGYTGDGFGSPDSTGFKPAGVVHEGEYVVPKRVLESQKGGRLVGALESMRLNKPTPLSSIGFANGGFTGGNSSMDLTGLRNEITMAVRDSIGAIQVVNNATDTVSEAVRVSNIQSEATFG